MSSIKRDVKKKAPPRNVRNMNPKKAEGLSPELQRALELSELGHDVIVANARKVYRYPGKMRKIRNLYRKHPVGDRPSHLICSLS